MAVCLAMINVLDMTFDNMLNSIDLMNWREALIWHKQKRQFKDNHSTLNINVWGLYWGGAQDKWWEWCGVWIWPWITFVSHFSYYYFRVNVLLIKNITGKNTPQQDKVINCRSRMCPRYHLTHYLCLFQWNIVTVSSYTEWFVIP